MTEITCVHVDVRLLRDFSVCKVNFYGHCIYDTYMDTIHKHINSDMYEYVGGAHAHMSASVEARRR